MFGLGIAKKGLEVAGILDEAEEVIQEEPVPVEPEKPITIIAKQVGPVKPFVKDPQKDLNHLVELFGIIEGTDKYVQCSCPKCGYVESALHSDVSSLTMDTEVVCSECGYEEEFADFYDETVERFKTSREPTDDECWSIISGHAEKNSLLEYYAYLTGFKKDPPIDSINSDALDAGMDEKTGRWYIHCSQRCLQSSCSCNNSTMNTMFGNIQSLQSVNNMNKVSE